MTVVKTTWMLAAISLCAAPAMAVELDAVYLGDPAHGGTGCPQGTVTSVLSEDAQTLSVLFDAYFVETEPGSRQDRASCNVAVPVHVPQGLSVALIEVDYRGYADIPAGAAGTFAAEYFFAGQRGPTRSRNFYSGYNDDFVVEDDLLVAAIVWSDCGDDVILRSNSNIRVRKNHPYGPDGYLAIDSADFQASLEFRLQWRECSP